MSTIKSSAEHLTLNADGASKDIKFQANGVEKASISSAGAFTSTTIDATKLTGNLPAISGAALTGVGVAGITSTADATAITIDSNENVGIGTGTPKENLDIDCGANEGIFLNAKHDTNGSFHGVYLGGHSVNRRKKAGMFLKYGGDWAGNSDIYFSATTSTSNADDLNIENDANLVIKADGRGLSQFTAKFWASANQSGTQALRDSHNISSITDISTGHSKFTFTNAMADANYSVTHSGYRGNYSQTWGVDSTFVKIEVRNDGGGNEDAGFLTIVGFGD